MSGKRKQASSTKPSEEEEKTQPTVVQKGAAKQKQSQKQPQAAQPQVKASAAKGGKGPSKAEAADSEPEEEEAEEAADGADGAEEDEDADMYDEEELAAAAAEEDAYYEEGDEDAEGDSGYDTDEVISFARQSGAIDQNAAKQKKKKDKKQKKAQADEEEEEPAEDFNVEFQFFDPRPEDRYAVKDMLRTFIGSDEKQFNAERMATAICEQVAIGTMVKTEDPAEQPIGFATILNAHQHKDLEPVVQLRKLLLAKCPEAQKAALQRLFDDTGRQLGLFIHERVINLPSELVPDLHAALFEDLKWAQTEAKKSKDPEERKEGALLDYENLLLVSKCFYEDVLNLPVDDDDDSDSDEDAKDQPPRKKTKAAASSSSSSSAPAAPSRSLTEGTAFFKYEDEFYEKESAMSFRFPMPTPQAVTPSEFLPQVGVACVVHKSKIPRILETIRSVLKEDYQPDE